MSGISDQTGPAGPAALVRTGPSTAAVALLGAAVLATGALAASPVVLAQTAPTTAAQWSDARWVDGAELDGGQGAAGLIELDWRATDQAGTTGVGLDFELELPDELSPVLGTSATGTRISTVPLVTGDGYIGATGTWTGLDDDSEPVVLEVELDDDELAYAAEEGVALSGEVELEVTWSDAALEELDSGEQELWLRGPGLDRDGAGELVAQYVAADQTSTQTSTSDRPTAAERPAADRTGGAELFADSDTETTKPKPTKPTKPKPKPTPSDRPKPTSPDRPDRPDADVGDRDSDSRTPVSRDAGGRERVSSVPSGPVGPAIMPTVG